MCAQSTQAASGGGAAGTPGAWAAERRQASPGCAWTSPYACAAALPVSRRQQAAANTSAGLPIAVLWSGRDGSEQHTRDRVCLKLVEQSALLEARPLNVHGRNACVLGPRGNFQPPRRLCQVRSCSLRMERADLTAGQPAAALSTGSGRPPLAAADTTRRTPCMRHLSRCLSAPSATAGSVRTAARRSTSAAAARSCSTETGPGCVPALHPGSAPATGRRGMRRGACGVHFNPSAIGLGNKITSTALPATSCLEACVGARAPRSKDTP